MASVKVVKCSGYIVKFCKECSTSAQHDCCNPPNDELYISPEDAKTRLLTNIYSTPIIFSHKNLPANVIGHVRDAYVDDVGMFVTCYIDNSAFLNLMKQYAEGYFVTELNSTDVNLPLFYKMIFPGYSLSHNPNTFETDHLAIVGTPRRKGTITSYEEIEGVPVKNDNGQNWMDISSSLYTYTLANTRIDNRKELLRENAKHSINKSTLFIEASHSKQASNSARNVGIRSFKPQNMDSQQMPSTNMTDVLKSVVDLCNKQQQQLQTFYVPSTHQPQQPMRTQFHPLPNQPLGYYHHPVMPMNECGEYKNPSDLVRQSVEFDGREQYPKNRRAIIKRSRPIDYEEAEDFEHEPYYKKPKDEPKTSVATRMMMEEFLKTVKDQQDQFMKKMEDRREANKSQQPVVAAEPEQQPMDATNYVELVNNISELKKLLAETQAKQQQQNMDKEQTRPPQPPSVNETTPAVSCALQDAGYTATHTNNNTPVLINAGVSKTVGGFTTKQAMVADVLEKVMMKF